MKLELLAIEEKDKAGMAVYLKPRTQAVLTPVLVDEIRSLQDSLANKFINKPIENTYYVIWYLCHGNRTSTSGLDYCYIAECLKSNRESLAELYIDRTLNAMYLNYIGLGFPIINCSVLTRYIYGIAREFLLMNHLCFLYNKNIQNICEIDLTNEISTLCFDNQLYKRNHYFFYKSLLLDTRIIHSTLEDISRKNTEEDSLRAIKTTFNKIREKILLRIYSIASKDIKILERFSKKMGCFSGKINNK